MRVSELIEALQEILEIDGDYPVYGHGWETEETFPIEDIQIDKVNHVVTLE
jgi:hypothetical protein